MKSIFAAAFAATLLAFSQASNAVESRAACSSLARITGYSSVLMTACVEDVQEVKNRNFNALDSCVAASAVLGPQYVADTLGCTSKTGLDFTKTSVGHLNFGIYADMVGKCAYNKPKACSITQQDFVDFIYGTLDDVCSTVWPDIKEVNNQWNKIVKWTKTGTSIPYSNFDDYLHYY